MNDEEKAQEFLSLGSITEYATFWIENKHTNIGIFTAENLRSEYATLKNAEAEYINTQYRTRLTHELETAKKKLRDVFSNLLFKFKTDLLPEEHWFAKKEQKRAEERKAKYAEIRKGVGYRR